MLLAVSPKAHDALCPTQGAMIPVGAALQSVAAAGGLRIVVPLLRGVLPRLRKILDKIAAHAPEATVELRNTQVVTTPGGLALAPRNGDIAANMDLARKGLKDRLEPPTTHRGVFFWQSALSPLESGIFASLAIGLGLWITVIGRVQRLRGRGALSSTVAWTGAVSGLLGVLVALSTVDELNQRSGAVVVASGVEVRSALGPSGVSLFVLHEGAEVSVSDATETHKLIALVDGRKGWVTSRALLSTDPSDPFVLAP